MLLNNKKPAETQVDQPVQNSAAGKDVNEALILAVMTAQLVHKVHGHAHKLDRQAGTAAHCSMHNGKADGDSLLLRQHKRQQRV